MSQQFHTIDRFRLEVEDDPTGLLNLAQNPNGDLGGWAYVTPVANTAVSRVGLSIGGVLSTALEFETTAAQACYWRTELIPMAAGEYVAARFEIPDAAAGVNTKARFEFYKADRTLLSSSAQTAALTASTTPRNVAVLQAPASTAFVALRWDLYRGTGNPSASDWMTFRGVTVCTSAVSTDLGATRTNLIANPSFETNLSGWTSPAVLFQRDGSTKISGSYSASASSDAMEAAAITVSPGSSYQISCGVRSTGPSTFVKLAWSNGVDTFPVQTDTVTHAADTWHVHQLSVVAPSPSPGAAAVPMKLRVSAGSASPPLLSYSINVDSVLVEKAATPGEYFDGSTPAAGDWVYGWNGTAHGSTSVAFSSNLQYAEPVQYRDITAPAISCTIERDTLNLGTLNAVIRDALLDPSRDDLIRPGRRVRAMALDNDDAWQPIFTGTLSNADVTYSLKDPSIPTELRARVEITGQDPQADLANSERPQGVALVSELPQVLEGCGIPWSVNGSGNQVGTANIVTDSPGQTAIDQIAMTRDSRGGLAWIDQRGILQAWDRSSLSATAVATLTEAEYSGFDVTWGTSDCINEVNVILRRINLANTETVEVPRGPFRDEASAKKWGPRSATFTVQGLADTDAAASAFAATVLTANATPQRRVNSVSYAAQDASAFELNGDATVFRDLCDLVRVRNEEVDFDRDLRVKTVKHTIEPYKWMVELGFGEPGAVEVPTMVPPVQSARSYASEACGAVVASTASSLAPGANVAVGVAFAQAFAAPPAISVAVTGWPSGTAFIVARVTGKTAGGFTFNFVNVGPSAATFTGLAGDWIATAR